jgi:hypothetical protein
MRKIALLSATALFVAGGALADDNAANIRIPLNNSDASGAPAGSVQSLTILQSLGSGNRIGTGTAATDAFTASGPWNGIAIRQLGNSNTFRGGVRSAAGGSGNLEANYAGSNNTQVLEVGLRTPVPLSPSITINVAGSNNTLTDLLDSGSLVLNRLIVGNSNNVLNDVVTTGLLAINETVTGSNNVFNRSGSAGGDVSLSATVVGDSNTLTTVLSTNSTAVDVTQNIRGNSNNLTATLNGAGTGSQTVVQNVNTVGLPASLLSYNGNTLTATLDNTGAGSQSLVQSVDAPTRIVTGGFNNNTLTATMIGTDQTVEQRIITTEVNRGNVGQSFTRARSQGNQFTISTEGDGNTVDARWGGSNGLIDITQSAPGTLVTFLGYGSANLGTAGSPGSAATVNVLQSGAGNSLALTSTAAPGAVMTVNSTQN